MPLDTTTTTSSDPAALYFVPSATWIEGLREGMQAPDCFGNMAEIVEIHARGTNIHGAPYVCLYTRLSESSRISGSFTAGVLHRTLAITGRHTSHELDLIERSAAE